MSTSKRGVRVIWVCILFICCVSSLFFHMSPKWMQITRVETNHGIFVGSRFPWFDIWESTEFWNSEWDNFFLNKTLKQMQGRSLKPKKVGQKTKTAQCGENILCTGGYVSKMKTPRSRITRPIFGPANSIIFIDSFQPYKLPQNFHFHS